MPRIATIERTTLETKVSVTVNLDGAGITTVTTGVGFLDHLLTSLGHHSLIDLSISCEGDVHIDDHHTVEDTMLVLGETLATALGDRAGISRYGNAIVPMDEALGTCAIDVGGRPYSSIQATLQGPSIGNFTTQNFEHGLEALARTGGFTLHLTATGRNDHHVAEAGIKSVARALRMAVAVDDRRVGIASTKGTT